MSRQIVMESGYQICTDGSLYPASIIVTNHLIRNDISRAREIFDKHGLEEFRHYMKYDGDYDAFTIKVYPEMYASLKLMLLELAEESRKMKEEDDKLAAIQYKIRQDAQDEFMRVFSEIDKLMGADE